MAIWISNEEDFNKFKAVVHQEQPEDLRLAIECDLMDRYLELIPSTVKRLCLQPIPLPCNKQKYDIPPHVTHLMVDFAKFFRIPETVQHLFLLQIVENTFIDVSPSTKVYTEGICVNYVTNQESRHVSRLFRHMLLDVENNVEPINFGNISIYREDPGIGPDLLHLLIADSRNYYQLKRTGLVKAIAEDIKLASKRGQLHLDYRKDFPINWPFDKTILFKDLQRYFCSEIGITVSDDKVTITI